MAIGTTEFQAAACRCFANLCTTSKAQVEAIEHGLALPLLRLGRSRDVGLKRHVARAIAKLSESHVCSRILIHRNVVTLLVDVVLSNDRETQIASVCALAFLCKGNETKRVMIENAMLPRFFLWAKDSGNEMKRFYALQGMQEFMVLFLNPIVAKHLEPEDIEWLSSQSGIKFPALVKNELSVTFNQTKINRLDPDAMLLTVVHKVKSLIVSDRAVVSLLTADDNALITVDDDPIAGTTHWVQIMQRVQDGGGKSFPGIVGEVFTWQRIEIRQNVHSQNTPQTPSQNGNRIPPKQQQKQTDDSYIADLEAVTRTKLTSILCAPLQNEKGNIIGIVMVLNKRGDKDLFTPQDEERMNESLPKLSDMVQLIAQKREALESNDGGGGASELEASKTHAAWEEKIMASVQSLDLRTVLRVLMGRAQTMLNADRSCFAVHLPESDRFWVIIPNGMKDFTMPATQGMLGLVRISQKPLLEPDVHSNPHFNKKIDEESNYFTRNMMCAPVFNSHGDFVGVCQLINKKRGLFTQIDLQKLTHFISQFVPAIQAKVPDLRAELTELAQRNGESNVYEILSNCISSPHPPNGVSALNIISAMVRHPDNHKSILEGQLFTQLVDVANGGTGQLGVVGVVSMRAATAEMRAEALSCLCNMSANREAHLQLLGKGAVAVFFRALTNNNGNRDVLFQGLRGLANLAQSKESHKQICKAASVARMLEEANYRKPRRRDDGNRVMSEKERSQLKLDIEAETALRTHHANTTQQALRVFIGLALEPENIPVLMQAGVNKKLGPLMMAGHPQITAVSVECVAKMCQHVQMCEYVIDTVELKDALAQILSDKVIAKTPPHVICDVASVVALVMEHRELIAKARDTFSFLQLQGLCNHQDLSVKAAYFDIFLEMAKDPTLAGTVFVEVIDRVKDTLLMVFPSERALPTTATLGGATASSAPNSSTATAEDSAVAITGVNGESLHNLVYSCARLVQELAHDEDRRVRCINTRDLIKSLCFALPNANRSAKELLAPPGDAMDPNRRYHVTEHLLLALVVMMTQGPIISQQQQLQLLATTKSQKGKTVTIAGAAQETERSVVELVREHGLAKILGFLEKEHRILLSRNKKRSQFDKHSQDVVDDVPVPHAVLVLVCIAVSLMCTNPAIKSYVASTPAVDHISAISHAHKSNADLLLATNGALSKLVTKPRDFREKETSGVHTMQS